MLLKNKICVITGASKGLGRSISLAFSREGAKIAINGRNHIDLKSLFNEITHSGNEAIIINGDVRKSNDVNQMTEVIIEKFGRIDVLVNNAGGAMFTNHIFLEVTEEEWDKVIDTNLKGAFLSCKAVVPYMIKQGGGKIINMSSLAGRSSGRLAGVQYSSAKAGLQGLTRHLARELGPHNITVNAIAPGIVFSDRVRNLYESKTKEDQLKMLEGTPLGRMGKPEEIAEVAIFLASGKSSYINGATIDVNGGAFMN
jgi:NAD(P)-dependent dehydrogenase (short-subunit alcohol dehydrogenase family)